MSRGASDHTQGPGEIVGHRPGSQSQMASMAVAVYGDGMSRSDHLVDQVRLTLDLLANAEEGGVHVVLG